MRIENLLKRKIVILDGATGTELQKRGMPQGVSPEMWCLENPKVIEAVHRDYCNAGSDIIYTSTFGANRIKLSLYGNYNVRLINKKLALIARKAAGKDIIVAGDIGPTGKFVEPFGELDFQEAVAIFKEQVQGLLEGGADIIVIETFMDIQEARAALIAVKEVSKVFTIVTMTYEKHGRTLNGTDCLTALITLQSLGADAVGCNCSTGPREMCSFIKAMKPYAKVPLAAKPNAGTPEFVNGKTYFNIEPKEFADSCREFISQGVNMLGGCCGTTPAHIKELKSKVASLKPQPPQRRSVSALSSGRKSLILEKNKPLIVVGECINPTGKKALRQELIEAKTSLVRRLAKEQEQNGADLLDVNVGAGGIDEKVTLKNIINLLAVATELPLVIDSFNIEAIEEALRRYPGRALINSLSAEKKRFKKLLAIAAKYGAMFILLPLDDKGIPHVFEERRDIIEQVYKEAVKFGFTKDDIVVDGVTLAISSNPLSVAETTKTISWCSNVFKCRTIIGLSNISFGVPNRCWVNSAYLAMVQAQGLTMVIANPLNKETMNIKRAADVLMNNDKDWTLFLKHFDKCALPSQQDNGINILPVQKVFNAIIEGNRDNVKEYVLEAFKSGIKSYDLIHKTMIPAITKVGDLFEKKEYFLPQLIASAEAMKIGFSYLEPYLKKEKSKEDKKIIVLLATVKGDVHDIGKNIVSLMLGNHGFFVVDLGRDVSAAKIIQGVKRYKAAVVGLSALMTTTMVNMKEVIDKAKELGMNCKFILGGAVVTKSYAQFLGAAYARDGVEAVSVVKSLVGLVR